MSKVTASMVMELREITGAGMMDCKRALTECSGDLEKAKEHLRMKGQALADKKSSRETKEGVINIFQRDKEVALIKIACETDFVARNDRFKEFIKAMAEQAIEVGTNNFMDKVSEKGPIKEQFVATIGKLGENIVYQNGIRWQAAENCFISTYTHTNNKIGVLVELNSNKEIDKDKQNTIGKDIAMHIAASKVEAVSEEDLDSEVLSKEKTFLMEQARESGKPENIIEKMVEGRMKKFVKEICLLSQNFVKDPDKSVAQYIAGCGNEVNAKLTVTRFFKEQF